MPLAILRRLLGCREPPTVPLDEQALFDIVGNSRRRQAIITLHDHGGPMDLYDLSRAVAGHEHDCDPAALSDDQRRSVYISLYQTHIVVRDGEMFRGKTCSMRTRPRKRSLLSRFFGLFRSTDPATGRDGEDRTGGGD